MDGTALSLMDVVSSEEDLLEQVNRRQMLQKVCKAVDTCLTQQEREELKVLAEIQNINDKLNKNL